MGLTSKFVKCMNKKGQKSGFVVDIQNNYPSNTIAALPDKRLLERWACATFEHEGLLQAELTLRLVDHVEMQDLNHRYRGKNQPTNVLSFPSKLPKEIVLDLPLLGDVIICVPVIESEAREQGKPVMAHWAHMVVHGTLHLLGYDHETENDAKIMEAKEKIILKSLNFSNPYEEEDNE